MSNDTGTKHIKKTAGFLAALASHFGGNAYIRNALDKGKWAKPLGNQFWNGYAGKQRGFVEGLKSGISGMALPEKTILKEKAYDIGTALKQKLPDLNPQKVKDITQSIRQNSGDAKDATYRKLRYLYHKYGKNTGLGRTLFQGVSQGQVPTNLTARGSYGAGKALGGGLGTAALGSVDPITAGYNATKLITGDKTVRTKAPAGFIKGLDSVLYKRHVDRYGKMADLKVPVPKAFDNVVNYGLNPVTRDIGVMNYKSRGAQKTLETNSRAYKAFLATPPESKSVPMFNADGSQKAS